MRWIWRAAWWPFRVSTWCAVIVVLLWCLPYVLVRLGGFDETMPTTEGWRWDFYFAAMVSVVASYGLAVVTAVWTGMAVVGWATRVVWTRHAVGWARRQK